MTESIVKNLNGKTVGTISDDNMVYTIIVKGCITTISANEDGTLKIEQSFVATPAA